MNELKSVYFLLIGLSPVTCESDWCNMRALQIPGLNSLVVLPICARSLTQSWILTQSVRAP